MESLGPQIRGQRQRLGLTLDELAGRTGISKPYLSLIETGRVANPPSDQKIRRIEQALGFTQGHLLSQAHLHRTPRDVRAILGRLLAEKEGDNRPETESGEPRSAMGDSQTATPVNLDDAYLSGVLQQLVENRSANVQHIGVSAIPIINRVSAGYPRDFTDLSYPRGVADDYIGCPDLHDPDAFATRVSGDSMAPKYNEGDIVIFSPAVSVRGGDDCFIRFEDGQTTFKRVFFESGEEGQAILRLQPRNEKYRPQMARSETVTGLYRAMYKFQTVDEE